MLPWVSLPFLTGLETDRSLLRARTLSLCECISSGCEMDDTTGSLDREARLACMVSLVL